MNTENLTKITWPEVRKGDVLMHENGDRLTVLSVKPQHNGRNVSVTSASLNLTSFGWANSGWTAHRKQPELPTEPGAYLDKNGVLLILTTDADSVPWLAVNINSDLSELRWMGGDRVVQRAPFTRLVPMPTQEALVEAIDHAELKDGTTISEDQADAVMTLLEAKLK